MIGILSYYLNEKKYVSFCVSPVDKQWYVYNDDNGSKVKISDLQSQENSTETSKGGPGIWRTLAIVFGILVLALAAFVLFLLKSIREGRSKTTRGRALEAAAAARDMDEDEEDEFFFEDDEPEDNEIEPEETDAQEETESEDTQQQNDGDADAYREIRFFSCLNSGCGC